MKLKRIVCLVLSCVISLSCLGMSGGAVEINGGAPGDIGVYATGRFNLEIAAGAISAANTSFPLEAGETVTIKATYSPFSASVDFGLIAPDGYFYYFNTTNGVFDKTIEIEERGNYTFAVRNNSSGTINVSGYVNY